MNGRPAGAASVLVSVGTDHHPFDRLVDWVERWAWDNPAVQVWMQRGTSRPPVDVPSEEVLSHAELCGRMAAADGIIVQGGPGGIIDSLRAGRLPVVVPRRADLGEHVDDHQVAFARHLASQNEVLLAESETELRFVLDAVANDPTHLHIAPRADRGALAARRIADEVHALVRRSTRA